MKTHELKNYFAGKIPTETDTLNEKQKIRYEDNNITIVLTLQFDDECKNGHKTFAMTYDLYEMENRYGIRDKHHTSCEAIGKKMLKKYFPKYAKYKKWHLTSTDGPLYYLENTLYWVKEGNFVNAKDSAVWPEVKSIHHITEETLRKRFPKVMKDFKVAMEEIGFVY